MSKKISVLFAYNAMNIGGSTTSLLSILNHLDYDKYDVDLLLNFNSGPLLDLLPEQVNLLPPSYKYTNKKQEYLHRFLSPKFMWHFIISKFIAKKSGVAIHEAQYREWKDIEFQRKIEKQYDVAVAFLEGDRCKFVARHIKAKRKIAWIHVNYIDAKFNPDYDRDTMSVFQKIVLVSDDCKVAFDKSFPELKEKTIVLENILSADIIKKRSLTDISLDIDNSKINLASACRISYKSKGLDRAVRAMSKLNCEGKLNNVAWYILGDGSDMDNLKSLIAENGLSDIIFPLGAKINPYSYLKEMSLFFLPSRFEGKPMAVTEAFMLGLPALVTEYSSAYEQIRHEVDGFVTENSEDGIYSGLKYIIENPNVIDRWKQNVINHDYSNVSEILKIQELLGE